MSSVADRIASLQASLGEAGLDYYFVPSADEHLNEYLPAWGARREYLSGFSGSAGDLMVGRDEAWLFTDGRYHTQAEMELKGSPIKLSKVGSPGHKTFMGFLDAAAAQRQGLTLGYDPMVLSHSLARTLEEKLTAKGGRCVAVQGNLVDPHWPDRPTPTTAPLKAVPTQWSGASVEKKLARVRERLGQNALVLVKLDQIAWLLNLRSLDDIPYNPVFESFIYLDPHSLHVFLRSADRRLPQSLRGDLPNLHLHEYDTFTKFLAELPKDQKVEIDTGAVTNGVVGALSGTMIEKRSAVEDLKACKNQAEVESMRRANRLASGAKTRALSWLKAELEAGRTVTEISFQEKLHDTYSALDDFWGLSFATISSTGAHGAIIHYKDADQTPIENGHLFLIDSGTHVAGGTTDDTRTVVIGPPTDEQRLLYTLVLKGHIRAASLKFPKGTAGTVVDAHARAPLWNEKRKFDHGTGHGVGCLLNVHEGPFALAESSRKPFARTPLEPGMITSIEPGYYRPDWGGIRIENLYLVIEIGAGERGETWLGFEPITWIPLEPDLIDASILESTEIEWLDRYDERMREELKNVLSEEEVRAIPPWRNQSG